MRLLMLGGTRFVGRHLVEAALERGHEVTLVHRGRTNPHLFAGVERLHRDREQGLALPGGRSWDAAVDTSKLPPALLRAEARVVAQRVAHMTYVSSASAYRDWPARPVDEDAALWDSGDDYGAHKAAAERALGEAFGERLLVVRPGLVVGAYEDVGRLPYWLARLARGGEVLAAGDARRPVQLIDARDLAVWMLGLIEARATGAFNAVSPPGFTTMAQVLEACRAATGSDATVTWVTDAHALAHGIQPWTQLPFWLPDEDGQRAVFEVAAQRAAAAGLRCRPIASTAHDTWAWLQAADGDDSVPSAEGLSPELEAHALHAWHAAQP